MYAFSNAMAETSQEEHLRCKECENAQSKNRSNGRGDGWKCYYFPRFAPSGNGGYFGKGTRNFGPSVINGEKSAKIPGVLGNLSGNRGNTHRAQDVTLGGEIDPKEEIYERIALILKKMKGRKRRVPRYLVNVRLLEIGQFGRKGGPGVFIIDR